MKFNLPVFFVAFLFSLAVGVIKDPIIEYVLQQSTTFGQWVAFSDYLSSVHGLIILCVSPLLVFVFFYYLGKRIDLTTDFLPVVGPLFFASWIGHSVAYLVMRLLYPGAPLFLLITSADYINATIQVVIFNAFSIEFFAALSALCIAHFLNQKPKPDTQ
ncbi:MAG: hypothetical protein CW691_06735 [Candidatus Bathyarchaeum sp.]|nr:MAG: hypothetical protein CW691_06735 [Candidatus Bathyarchaeum sp.]